MRDLVVLPWLTFGRILEEFGPFHPTLLSLVRAGLGLAVGFGSLEMYSTCRSSFRLKLVLFPQLSPTPLGCFLETHPRLEFFLLCHLPFLVHRASTGTDKLFPGSWAALLLSGEREQKSLQIGLRQQTCVHSLPVSQHSGAPFNLSWETWSLHIPCEATGFSPESYGLYLLVDEYAVVFGWLGTKSSSPCC